MNGRPWETGGTALYLVILLPCNWLILCLFVLDLHRKYRTLPFMYVCMHPSVEEVWSSQINACATRSLLQFHQSLNESNLP